MDRPYDYYGHSPLVELDRPLVLIGFAGAGVARTARVLTILTGLPLVLLDRAVEHRAGMSLDRLIVEHGQEARHGHEAELLERFLDQDTAPVIAAGDATLLDPQLRWTVRTRARVVWLRMSFDEAIARLTRIQHDDPMRHFALLGGAAPDPASLRPRFDLLESSYRDAHVVVDVDGRIPRRVAEGLLDRLGLDVPG